MIPGFPIPTPSSGTFAADARKRIDWRTAPPLRKDHMTGYDYVDLSKYKPEKPERYKLETVESMMYLTDAVLIEKYMGFCNEMFNVEDHSCLDIGTYHGASAIIMAKYGNFNVITLDPYPGNHIMESFEHHGVANKIQPYTIKSEDFIWPKALQIPFMLIDGLHELTQVMFEFHYFGKFIPKGGYVAFHDVGKGRWPGMARVIHEACDVGEWKMVDLEGFMCVLEKL